MSQASSDILLAIDTLSTEKGISRNLIIEAIEKSFKENLAKYYDTAGEFVVKMDLKSGDILPYEKRNIVLEAESDEDISLADAKKIKPDAEEGKSILIPLPQVDRNLLPVSSLRRNILFGIRSVEKEIEYNEYKKREGEIITGVVKKASPVSVIVGIGNNTEAILRKADLIKTDNYKMGDKVKAYIKEVIRSDKDLCQVILSRTDNNFLAMLIAENSIEVQDGMVDIKAISRQCGIKAKVAVVSNDGRLDGVGACIGARGSRIKPVVDELRGERVDIVYWDRDLVNFAKNAITPAKAIYGKYDENTNSIELVVADDQLKLAIGKGGVNVRLASQLVGCDISVVAESEKKKVVQEKFKNDMELIVSALDVEEPVAQFLVSSNICTPADLINVGTENLVKSGVFTEEIANELINRATNYIEKQKKETEAKLASLGIDAEIMDIDAMTPEIAVSLGMANVKTLQDVADLSSDELIEICGDETQSVANQIIMTARQKVYGI